MNQQNLQPLQNWRSALGGSVRFMREGDARPTDPNQPPQTPVSPFAAIDRDLLDDATKKHIETAETQWKETQGKLATVATIQAEHDRLKAELAQIQTGQQRQQEQQKQSAQPTFEDEIREELIRDGYKPEEATRFAKTQAKVFNKFADRTQAFVGQQIAPIHGNLAMQEAHHSFLSVSENPRLAQFIQDPELAQDVWDRVGKFVEQGGKASPEFVSNLVKIMAVDRGLPITPVAKQSSQQMTTRSTYPGAGANVRTPVENKQVMTNLDPETRAAAEMTKDAMKNGFTNGKSTTKIQITRGA